MTIVSNCPVFAVGDLHGNFHWLKHFIKKYDFSKCIFLILGDCSLGFSTYEAWMRNMHKIGLPRELSTRGIKVLFMRGNHDDPSWFKDKLLHPTMIALADYSVIKTPEHNILCIGGGISLDRSQRLEDIAKIRHKYFKYHPNKSEEDFLNEVCLGYWKDEAPVFDKSKLNLLTDQIDVVCSHVAPLQLPPVLGTPQKWKDVDKALAKDCMMERKTMSKILKYLVSNGHPLSKWYYGHYHKYQVSEYKNITGYTLDMARNGSLSIKEIL